MSITYSYQVPDVMCGNCSGTLERALKQAKCLKGMRFAVDVVEKKLLLTLDEAIVGYHELRDVLNEILEPVGFVCVAEDAQPVTPASSSIWYHRALGFFGVSSGLGVAFILLFLAPLSLVWSATMAGGCIALTLILGAESYQHAAKKIRSGLLTMDSLFAISTLTILIVSTLALFFPALPMLFDAGLLIFGFRHIGISIDKALRHVHGVSHRFQDSVPTRVKQCTGDRIQSVPLAAIKRHDVIQLATDDTLPIDGVFLNSKGILVNDCIVTGSMNPRALKPGEYLYAGTKIIYAPTPVRLRAEAGVQQSHLARLDMKITKAKLERSPLETSANRILHYFIPAVVALAIVSGIVVATLFSFALAIQSVVAILVSACPCTLGLITPLAMKIGMKKAADHGIVFNSAKKLEAADNIHCVVFDLNGTLTEGTPRVKHYQALQDSGLTNQHFIALMARFEARSLHPVAQAIRQAGGAVQDADALAEITIESTDHAGLLLKWQGEQYVLGSETLLLKQGIHANAMQQLAQKITVQEGDTVVYCARAGRLIGYIVLHDQLRPHAKETIAALLRLGIEPYLRTGADGKTAARIAKAVGIPLQNVRADCVSHAAADSLQSKKQLIDALKKAGHRVAVVGDGANDAEMIAASDFGIAIESSSGHQHAQQEAAAIIHSNTLQPIVHAFVVAKQTVKLIKQNLLFSVCYNLFSALMTGGLLLALGIVLHPAVGALLMILQSSLILFNVSRFAQQTLPDVAIDSTSTKAARHSYSKSMRPLLTPTKHAVGVQAEQDVLIHPAVSAVQSVADASNECRPNQRCI